MEEQSIVQLAFGKPWINFIGFPQQREVAQQSLSNFISLPCVKGGGFCVAKLGGIVLLSLRRNYKSKVYTTIPQSLRDSPLCTRGPLLCASPTKSHNGSTYQKIPLKRGFFIWFTYAVTILLASVRFSIFTASSRILYFRILPAAFIGNESTNAT